MIQVALVARSLALRAGLRALLGAALADPSAGALPASFALEVVAEAANLHDLETPPQQVDVLVLASDIQLALDELRTWLQRTGAVAILRLTDDVQAARQLAALPVRAWGVLSLDAGSEELQTAVRALHQGLWVGDPHLVKPVLGELLAAPGELSAELVAALSEREMDVLQLLAYGLSNKQIALRLGISEHTVKFHVSAIYTKLGAGNRTEAVRLGVQSGLVTL